MLQDQKLNKLVIDPINAKEFERPFNSHARLNDQAEKSSVNNQVSGPTNAKQSHTHTHTVQVPFPPLKTFCIIYDTGAETQ